MMEKIEMYQIEYEKPKVTLLQQSGLGVAEIAARTCYDSFENSENECVKTALGTPPSLHYRACNT